MSTIRLNPLSIFCVFLLFCSCASAEGIAGGIEAVTSDVHAEKNNRRFDSVNIRTWATKDNPNSFPEIADTSVAIPWLKNRPSFGIAFSGGGTRSATATLGQLRALKTLGWLDQARYISANSGSSWTSVPYVFLPEQFDEVRFLGSYISPDRIRDAELMAEEDDQAMESTIFHARVIDPVEPTKLLSMLKGDESYSNFVGEVFLKRFDLNDRHKFFTSHDTVLHAILQGNPDLKPDDFYLTHKNRPYLIVVGTLLTPSGEGFLVEATPFYTGLRNEFVIAANKKGDSKQMLIGGGYLESFGYDSYEPEQSVLTSGRWNVRLKGDVLRKDRPTNKRYRFTLLDVIGMSSAAPHITLAKKKIPSEVFPEFRHWAVDRQRIQNDAQFDSEAKELKHGDGGDIDNLALLPLLARQVENILVFINTPKPFSKNTSCDNVTTDVLIDDLVSFFQPVSEFKDNIVFADGKAQLSTLCQQLVQKKQAGEPLVYCQRYTIQANPRQGVESGSYAPSICWSYLDRTQQWIDKISSDNTGRHTIDLKNGWRDFADFPHYKTFGEQGAAVIDLDRERVRALSNLTAWSIYESAPYIASKLPNVLLSTENRPANSQQSPE